MVYSRPTRGFAAVCASIALLNCLPSMAGEIAIYESLSDVTIGRVFLSPKQRAYLDTRPVMSPQPVPESPPPEPAEPVERKKDPAGYFISSSGVSSVWSQNGFVTRKDASGISFPGDIKVIRKETAESLDLSSTEIREPASDGKSEAADNGA